MPDYDPTLEALVAQVVEALDPPEDGEPQSYIDNLRRAQAALMVQLQQEASAAPTAEDEAVLRQALGVMDAKSEDRYLGYGEVVRRVLSAIDKELMRWTSAPEQAMGPSGDAVTPPPVAPEEPVARGSNR